MVPKEDSSTGKAANSSAQRLATETAEHVVSHKKVLQYGKRGQPGPRGTYVTNCPTLARQQGETPANTAQQWYATEPFIHLHCALAEGPYYEPATGTLRFVDIRAKRIHTAPVRGDKTEKAAPRENAAAPASATTSPPLPAQERPDSLAEGGARTIQLDVPVGATANICGCDPQDRILVALKYGVAVLDRRTGAYKYVAEHHQDQVPEQKGRNERLRSNDAAVDPHGRFWVGTMSDFPVGESAIEGALYCYDLRHGRQSLKPKKQTVLSSLRIPNGIGWSPDRRTLYFTHSATREIFVWDYDAGTGAFSNRRLFYRHQSIGEPDGCRVDSLGNVWQAMWGEGLVIRISPDDGSITGQIHVPTRYVTCCEFVGTELFITTAQDDGEGGGTRSMELGGAVFRVDVGVEGLPHFEAKLGE